MRVLAIGAHPDDLEILCGGTLARMVAEGHEVTMAHATDGARGGGPGDDPARMAQLRAREAEQAAALAGARHVCVGLPDGEVSAADPAHRRALAELMRATAPDLLLTHHPDDYHGDHREVSRLVFDTSFTAANPLVEAAGAPLPHVPALHYVDTLGGLGFAPTEYVDVSAWAETKLAMLRCHASQLTYLSETFGVDVVDQVDVHTRFRGLQCGVAYAEAFQPCMTWHRPRTRRLLP